MSRCLGGALVAAFFVGVALHSFAWAGATYFVLFALRAEDDPLEDLDEP